MKLTANGREEGEINREWTRIDANKRAQPQMNPLSLAMAGKLR
jgi:hypothetical protein